MSSRPPSVAPPFRLRRDRADRRREEPTRVAPWVPLRATTLRGNARAPAQVALPTSDFDTGSTGGGGAEPPAPVVKRKPISVKRSRQESIDAIRELHQLKVIYDGRRSPSLWFRWCVWAGVRSPLSPDLICALLATTKYRCPAAPRRSSDGTRQRECEKKRRWGRVRVRRGAEGAR